MSIDIFFLVLIGGLLLGGIYALVAFGLSLIYGVARILNIVHGTLLAISGVGPSFIEKHAPEVLALVAAHAEPLAA